jgi:hypothetical protein
VTIRSWRCGSGPAFSARLNVRIETAWIPERAFLQAVGPLTMLRPDRAGAAVRTACSICRTARLSSSIVRGRTTDERRCVRRLRERRIGYRDRVKFTSAAVITTLTAARHSAASPIDRLPDCIGGGLDQPGGPPTTVTCETELFFAGQNFEVRQRRRRGSPPALCHRRGAACHLAQTRMPAPPPKATTTLYRYFDG